MSKIKFLLGFLLISWVSMSVAAINQARGQSFLASNKRSHFTIPLEKRRLGAAPNSETIKLIRDNKQVSLFAQFRSKIDGDGYLRIPQSNLLHTMYFAKIGFGSPSNTFDLLMDTGSVNIFVDSTLCKDGGCQKMHQYDSKSSSTYTKSSADDETEVVYGSGTVDGQEGYDDLYIGELRVKQAKFYQIVEELSIFKGESSFDGVLGLSKSFLQDSEDEANNQRSYPIMQQIKEQGLLDRNIFTFNMNKNERYSEFILGGYLADKMGNNIKWFSNVHDSYWMIPLDKIILRDLDTKVCQNDCYAIIDTGTAYIAAPKEGLEKLVEDIGPFQCKNYKDLPDINFVLDNNSFGISSSDYVLNAQTDYPGGKDECIGAFIQFSMKYDNKKIWVLGDAFITKYLVLFDYDNDKIGIAPKLGTF